MIRRDVGPGVPSTSDVCHDERSENKLRHSFLKGEKKDWSGSTGHAVYLSVTWCAVILLRDKKKKKKYSDVRTVSLGRLSLDETRPIEGSSCAFCGD